MSRREILCIFLSLLAVCWSCPKILAAENPRGKRIIILVDEQFQNLKKTPQATEHYLRRLFEEHGFFVVDKKQANEIKKRAEIYHFMQGDPDGALAASLRYEADIVLRGKAIIQNGNNLGNSRLKPRLASVTFDIFDTRTGKVLYSRSSSGTYPHIDELQGGIEALKISIDNCSKDLLTSLMPQFGRSGNVVDGVEIAIEGVSHFADYGTIQKLLSQNGFELEAIRYASNTGYYRAITTDNVRLAENLSRIVLNGRTIEVVEMTPNKIQAKIKTFTVY